MSMRGILEEMDDDRLDGKTLTMDDMINSYPRFHDWRGLMSKVPPEFVELWKKHKDKFYLSVIAKAILAELGIEATEEKLHNVQGWVYNLGEMAEREVAIGRNQKSEELKAKLADYVGKSAYIKIHSEGFFGASDSGYKKYRVVKAADGRVAIMSPNSRTKGYVLDNPDLVIVDVQDKAPVGS
jgi:hypothetical protein